MADSLIRCSEGCGAVLSFRRLREGYRGPGGIMCERCVAARCMRDCVSALGLTGAEAQDFVTRGVAWILSEDADFLPSPASPR